MNIYKITLRETGSFINWNTLYGIADSMEAAMQNALEAEAQDEIELEVLSAEAIAECSFAPSVLDLAA